MLNLLNVKKEVIVNGVPYASPQAALEALKGFSGAIEVRINSKSVPQTKQETQQTTKQSVEYKDIYRIEVRQYMTEKGSPEFDFMKKYNNDVPMPARRMYGEILEETKGMYKMKLQMRAERDAVNCMHCMRQLTNPISRIYGIGPICGEHGYFASDYTKSKIKDEEQIFKMADAELRKVEWTGWVIKKAILSFGVIEQVKIKEEATA